MAFLLNASHLRLADMATTSGRFEKLGDPPRPILMRPRIAALSTLFSAMKPLSFLIIVVRVIVCGEEARSDELRVIFETDEKNTRSLSFRTVFSYDKKGSCRI